MTKEHDSSAKNASGNVTLMFDILHNPHVPITVNGKPPQSMLKIESASLSATIQGLEALQDTDVLHELFAVGVLETVKLGKVIPATDQYAPLRDALPDLTLDMIYEDEQLSVLYPDLLARHSGWVKMRFDMLFPVAAHDTTEEQLITFTTRTPGIMAALSVFEQATTEDNIQKVLLETTQRNIAVTE